jgi:hypothetical protein
MKNYLLAASMVALGLFSRQDAAAQSNTPASQGEDKIENVVQQGEPVAPLSIPMPQVVSNQPVPAPQIETPRIVLEVAAAKGIIEKESVGMYLEQSRLRAEFWSKEVGIETTQLTAAKEIVQELTEAQALPQPAPQHRSSRPDIEAPGFQGPTVTAGFNAFGNNKGAQLEAGLGGIFNPGIVYVNEFSAHNVGLRGEFPLGNPKDPGHASVGLSATTPLRNPGGEMTFTAVADNIPGPDVRLQYTHRPGPDVVHLGIPIQNMTFPRGKTEMHVEAGVDLKFEGSFKPTALPYLAFSAAFGGGKPKS